MYHIVRVYGNFAMIHSLHPLFPGSNEVDQIAKIHDVMGTPDPAVIGKLRKYVMFLL